MTIFHQNWSFLAKISYFWPFWSILTKKGLKKAFFNGKTGFNTKKAPFPMKSKKGVFFPGVLERRKTRFSPFSKKSPFLPILAILGYFWPILAIFGQF
jgi:hypothetical protein